MQPTVPRFHVGEPVVLKSTREIGAVEREGQLDAGEYWYRVRFQRRGEEVAEVDLDALDPADTSIEQLATHGRWGRLEAFRRAVAWLRLENVNRSTVYAFNAQRILFEPYQYKPLLKILDSPDRRLLIADEVGLGKTIEAGLILTELEARGRVDKVLVVCPSRLRDKWREELNRKFDQDFDILDRRTLRDYMRKLAESPRRSRLRGIISLQTLRSQDLRDEVDAQVGHVDLVVVDEAHHARNPSTLTSALLEDLAKLGDAVLLLTATPVHLGSRDLFTLLKALRPVEYQDPHVFDRDLRNHSGVHEAAALVRQRSGDRLRQAAKRLSRLFVNGVLPIARDPLAVQVIADMEASPPRDRREWVELERRVHDLHPLARILTRTRKRDVQEKAPTRRAGVVKCRWTDEEDATYQRLVAGSTKLGWIREGLTLGGIQRARQAASCLPAALEARAARPATSDDEAIEATDILPSDHPGAKDDKDLPVAIAAPQTDSKFDKLVELLRQVASEEPRVKMLIFTFFVGTSKYLERRLAEEGFPALRIAGDVTSNPHDRALDERGNRVLRFRDDPAITVLVSTEVGSEGLDFQFCHHIVNYDLPWNPMVVEQRIGRIDRWGQKSNVVHIHNLVVEGTVEDLILLRLYDRIKIFEKSIGDLDAILGETVRELEREYVSGLLTPEESARRSEEAANAIERKRIDLEKLEEKAGELFGYEEYIRDEMQRVRQLGRFVSEKALLSLIAGFLQARHPGVQVYQDSPEIYGIRLTEELRSDIRGACPQGQEWFDPSKNGHLLFTTNGAVAFNQSSVELLNVTHPLVRAAKDAMPDMMKDPSGCVGAALLDLPEGQDAELEEGVYFLVVFLHQVEGMRSRKVLEPIVWAETGGRMLEAELGERLLHIVTEDGRELTDTGVAPALEAERWRGVLSEMRRRNRELLGRERAESGALYARRKRIMVAEYDQNRRLVKGKLRTAKEHGRDPRILRMFEAQLQKVESRHHDRLVELERHQEASARFTEPLAACVIQVRRRKA